MKCDVASIWAVTNLVASCGKGEENFDLKGLHIK